jgi:CO dehydrogenase/acetyl-CoA synthase gamma subunit (corrinoid Fe-S protein)
VNERIEKLAAKHALYVDGGAGKTNYTFTKESLKEFTELIVRECAEHALTFNNNLQSLNDKEIRTHSSRVSDYILDRMGVEE